MGTIGDLSPILRQGEMNNIEYTNFVSVGSLKKTQMKREKCNIPYQIDGKLHFVCRLATNARGTKRLLRTIC